MRYSWNQKLGIRACEVHEMAKKQSISEMCQIWIEARKRYPISDAQIQMARELGLNPNKFGKLANEKQEPWEKTSQSLSKRFISSASGKGTGLGSKYRATDSGTAGEEGGTKGS